MMAATRTARSRRRGRSLLTHSVLSRFLCMFGYGYTAAHHRPSVERKHDRYRHHVARLRAAAAVAAALLQLSLA